MPEQTKTTNFEAEAFRLEMENIRLRKWLTHIYEMKDKQTMALREAAHYALEGDVI